MEPKRIAFPGASQTHRQISFVVSHMWNLMRDEGPGHKHEEEEVVWRT